MNFCSLLCVVFAYVSIAYASSCIAGSEVQLPNLNQLLSLADFDTHVVDQTLGEFLYFMPNPPPYNPYINYFITFEKESEGHYVQKTSGETPGSNPICKRSESAFDTNVTVNKASFYNEITQSYTVFWSESPSSYVLTFRCKSSSAGAQTCLVENSYIGILLPGIPYEILTEGIVQDLWSGMFSTDCFKTFFTYGEEDICADEGK